MIVVTDLPIIAGSIMPLPNGTRLGPYELLSPVGAGGMGEVYRARDTRLNRDVAVKVLPAIFAEDVERLRRFEQEARAAAALSHPNILSVFDIGTTSSADSTITFIVSELLEGETLKRRLQDASATGAPGREPAARALSVRKALDYAIQLAQGLAAAHERGIVHRDLKPDNVFLTTDGRIKILDFGLAKLTENGASPGLSHLATAAPDTQPGVLLGTMGYMAPEQVRGAAVDHRADIFAFGAVLYEMLSGSRAFQGATPADTISAILDRDPPDLSSVVRQIPAPLASIVDRCLDKNPGARFQSAADLKFALGSLSIPTSGQLEPPEPARPVTSANRRERMAWAAAACCSQQRPHSLFHTCGALRRVITLHSASPSSHRRTRRSSPTLRRSR